MNAQHSAYIFSEGKITLPAQYQDRSVNQLLPVKPGPAISINRDLLATGKDLATYITEQLNTLAPKVPGFTQHARSPVQLGANLYAGEFIHISFVRETQRISQMQAIFHTEEGRVLIFSMSKMGEFAQSEQKQFSDMVASFTCHEERA